MGWQAIEAVQDHSTINDSTGLCVFLAIARFANADGVVGAGGRATSPSAERIASAAHVSRRTVFNWVPKLEATGELTVERMGSGRGQWNRYTINLPMSINGASIGEPADAPKANIGASNGANIGESIAAPLANNGASIGESMDAPITLHDLAVMVHELKVLVNETVHIGAPAGAPDTEDTDLDTDQEKKKNIYIPGEAQQIITALAEISKTPYWPKTEEAYLDAAYCLIGYGATPEQVGAFAKWWSENGFYSGKPALKSILDDWKNYRDGVVVTAAPHKNGAQKTTAADSYAEVFGS